MEITIKCPNCNEQVPHDSVYCEFCGIKLSGASTSSPDPINKTVEDSAAYVGPKFCPNNHKVTNPALGFCPDCGMPLIDKPKPMIDSPVPPLTSIPPIVHVTTPRICRNGHSYDDPALVFCPECGLRFDSDEITITPTDEHVSRSTSREEDYGSIPAGLRPATEDDLCRK